MKLLVATANVGKLREIAKLLEGRNIEVLGLGDIGSDVEIVEDGETFLENSLKKARTLHNVTGLPTLADDSGLVVNALGGAPGVRSARYSEEGTDNANNLKLLGAMKDVPEGARGCNFVCAMVFIDAGGVEHATEGRLSGVVAARLDGEGGFGYDPLFYLPERGTTVAHLPVEEKNLISHRGRALEKLVPVIIEALSG